MSFDLSGAVRWSAIALLWISFSGCSQPPAVVHVPDAAPTDQGLAAEVAKLSKQIKSLETAIKILDHRIEVMDAGRVQAADHARNPSVAARLEKRITMTFPRDTLERALQILSADTCVPIEILGQDLQLDGITKNQSFGLDEHDRPAVDILEKILMLANPDGQLVYVIKENARGGRGEIELTTRSAAAKRGDTLPKSLQPSPSREHAPPAQPETPQPDDPPAAPGDKNNPFSR